MTVGLNLILVAAAVVFAIGAAGLLIKRSVIVMLIGTQLMLAGGGLTFVGFARFGLGADDPHRGMAVALFTAAIGLGELAIGAAMAAVIYREQRTFLVDEYESVAR